MVRGGNKAEARRKRTRLTAETNAVDTNAAETNAAEMNATGGAWEGELEDYDDYDEGFAQLLPKSICPLHTPVTARLRVALVVCYFL